MKRNLAKDPRKRGGEAFPTGPLPRAGSTNEYDSSSNPPKYESIEEARLNPVVRPTAKSGKVKRGCGCLPVLSPFLLIFLVLLAFLLFPGKVNILLLGIDARPEEGNLGRSDTNILLTMDPLKPYIGALSIPRDLWVNIPGIGENRINTAHFFAEAAAEGTGPHAAIETVETNFGVNINYFVRIRFTGFQQVIDAMGGVEVDFPTDMSGYSMGTHHLNGEQALALVRDRAGSDDFSRMGRGQLFLKSAVKQMLKPASWPRIPAILTALNQAVDTNIPVWQWPRIGMAFLRVGPNGIDTRSITREMVNPFTTSGGANVLGPNWEMINPAVDEMFGP